MKAELYFLALVAPAGIDVQIRTWKIHLLEKYGCRAGLKSPAHITLIPPFRMEENKEAALAQSLDRFAETQRPCSIQLSGFGQFGTRVIYVQVLPNPPLVALQQEIAEEFRKLSFFPWQPESRSFTPHLTIASRDLAREYFDEAWAYFRERSYSAHFESNSLDLLRLAPGRWEIVHRSPLCGS